MVLKGFARLPSAPSALASADTNMAVSSFRHSAADGVSMHGSTDPSRPVSATSAPPSPPPGGVAGWSSDEHAGATSPAANAATKNAKTELPYRIAIPRVV
jgi:hypothetical protein